MYGSRTGNALDLLPLILYVAVCLAAGWALVRAGFDVSAGDRPLVGGALGLVLASWLANVFAHWLEPPAAFWLAALALAAAAALAYRSRPDRAAERLGTNALVLLAVVVLLALLFARMGRGLAIFDDRKNLSLISLMAAGEIPPRFYMNPDFPFAYHYAFQLFGAMLMRLGGLMPWSAFDLAKGIAAALAIGLVVVWGRRSTGTWKAAAWLGAVVLFASGARWLLLLFPAPWVQAASQGLLTWGSTAQTQASLSALLNSAWGIEGGPPFPLPFAFVNGILQPFILYLQTGPVSMGLIALLLVLVLFPARARRWTWGVFAALLAFWALAAEAGFVLFALGTVGACAVVAIPTGAPERRRTALSLLAVVALATLLAILQGGTLTEAARGIVFREASGPAGSGVAGFTLRAVPSIVSSHLGELRLTRPGEALIGLFELGPALFLAPLAAWLAVRAARRGRVVLLAVVLSTFVGFLLPFVVRYEVDRDITRLTYYALLGWVLLAVIPLSSAWSRAGVLVRGATVVLTVALILPGVVLTGPLMTALPRAVFTSGFLPADASMTRLVWNRLEPGSLVVDSDSWRAVAVTGRLTRSAEDSSTLLPAWQALRLDPRVGRIVGAGFGYAYVDRASWDEMSAQTRLGYQDTCVREVASVHDNGANGDRWLFDLRDCPAE